MRLSDADREALIELLSRHAGAGRLDTGELERRVEIVVRAATREQAAPAIDDLPPLPAAQPGATAVRADGAAATVPSRLRARAGSRRRSASVIRAAAG